VQERLQFYIDGAWTDPAQAKTLDVINPATEESCAKISLGSAADVDKAVSAAQAAFPSWSRTSVKERVELLDAILEAYKKRYDEMAETISTEMGAPIWLSKAAQAGTGLGHFKTAKKVLESFTFEEDWGATHIMREPIGVCGFITPWNWPMNQVTCKVAPALAAGCTVVLKPSEVAPLNAMLLAEILDEAGVPKGVFNLVNGDGPGVGDAIARHEGVDMVSFTGSTRAGIQVAKAAADTVKRVAQELGGKSANIILESADLQKAVKGGVMGCFVNTGQSCDAPTRMLVPAKLHDEAAEIAKAAAEASRIGDPMDENTRMGPAASEQQFNKIQEMIQKGIDEGAQLVAGGTGRPEGFNKGYYVRPTVFAGVNNDMTIAREEIFGPVLSILPYKDEAEAIAIANDTPYGLSGQVSGELEDAQRVAKQMRTGQVRINGAQPDFNAPFGGYKQSGNGREWGVFGFEEFLEVKAINGWQAA